MFHVSYAISKGIHGGETLDRPLEKFNPFRHFRNLPRHSRGNLIKEHYLRNRQKVPVT